MPRPAWFLITTVKEDVLMFKSILVPTDGSPLAEKTFGPAIETAKANNGKIIGISVTCPYIHPRPTE